MENNKIEAVIQGLKCDNVECDYVDMDIPYEEYDKYVEQPCPKCGEVILTTEDFETVKGIMTLVNFVNTSDMLGDVSNEELNKDKSQVSVDLDGTGNMSIKVEAVKEDGQ